MAGIGFELADDLIGEARKYLNGRPQRVCISKPSLGELTMKMAEAPDPTRGTGYTDAMEKLRRSIDDGDLHVSWVRDFPDGLATVRRYLAELRDVDSHLDPTDRLIIACALADTDATVLYSTDAYARNMRLSQYTSGEEGLALKSLM